MSDDPSDPGGPPEIPEHLRNYVNDAVEAACQGLAQVIQEMAGKLLALKQQMDLQEEALDDLEDRVAAVEPEPRLN